MDTNQLVRLHAVPHPSAPVRQAGFPLDHPYIEQCWASLIGPTSVLLLRRLPVWCQSRHTQLPGAHLDGLAQLHAEPVSPTNLVARLDRLSRPSPTARPVPSLHR